MKVKAIITGVTGMVGEGVLQECLQNNDVEQVLVVNRKPCGITHPKLKEIIHSNFMDLSPIAAEFKSYNACYFCLGVTSIGKKEDEYTRLTYDITLHFANAVAQHTTELTFCYVSGGGTDSTEKGKSMWARVKGKTENDLLALPFKQAYMFRPGFLKPTDGAKNVNKYYKYIGWLYPVIRMANGATTLQELGRAMINATIKGYSKKVIEIKDIITLAKQ